MKCYIVIKCNLAARVNNPWQLGSVGATLDYIARQYGVRKLADGSDHVVYALADMFGQQEIDYIKVLVHFNRTAGCSIECLPVQSRREYHIFLLPLAGQDWRSFGEYIESIMVENLIRYEGVEIVRSVHAISPEAFQPTALIRLAKEHGLNRIYAGRQGVAIVAHTGTDRDDFLATMLHEIGDDQETERVH